MSFHLNPSQSTNSNSPLSQPLSSFLEEEAKKKEPSNISHLNAKPPFPSSSRPHLQAAYPEREENASFSLPTFKELTSSLPYFNQAPLSTAPMSSFLPIRDGLPPLPSLRELTSNLPYFNQASSSKAPMPSFPPIRDGLPPLPSLKELTSSSAHFNQAPLSTAPVPRYLSIRDRSPPLPSLRELTSNSAHFSQPPSSTAPMPRYLPIRDESPPLPSLREPTSNSAHLNQAPISMSLPPSSEEPSAQKNQNRSRDSFSSYSELPPQKRQKLDIDSSGKKTEELLTECAEKMHCNFLEKVRSYSLHFTNPTKKFDLQEGSDLTEKENEPNQVHHPKYVPIMDCDYPKKIQFEIEVNHSFECLNKNVLLKRLVYVIIHNPNHRSQIQNIYSLEEIAEQVTILGLMQMDNIVRGTIEFKINRDATLSSRSNFLYSFFFGKICFLDRALLIRDLPHKGSAKLKSQQASSMKEALSLLIEPDPTKSYRKLSSSWRKRKSIPPISFSPTKPS